MVKPSGPERELLWMAVVASSSYFRLFGKVVAILARALLLELACYSIIRW